MLAAVMSSAVVACGNTATQTRRGSAQQPVLTGAPASGNRSVGPPGARVVVAHRNHALVVPRSFFGISTEYWTIPLWAKHLDLLGRVFSLITQEGPVVLRIGGDSADRGLWSPTKELPEWVFELTPSWLRQVSAIVRRFGVKLILYLNLLTATPTSAAKWAREAEHRLPRGSILGFEIGNEPDIYNPASFRSKTRGAGKHRPKINAVSYASAYRTYDDALDRAVPRIPLLAPALAEPQKNVRWIATLLAGSHHGLTAITAHRYPLSQCARSGPMVPTIARVLSERATAGMAATLRPAIRIAHRARLAVRLTEFNSVTCGGTAGISDTFATAVWAPDALFELIHAGVRSAALHVRARAINMAFSLTRHGLIAYPLLYGLIVYARTLGTDPQLLPARVSAVPGSRLKVWTVLDGKQLRVLLIDKSARAETFSLTLPAVGAAKVQRLLAPSVSATSGITLNGQSLDSEGHWSRSAHPENVEQVSGSYTISIPGMSAAIISAGARSGTS